jgi:hypothetical protein
VEINKWFPEEAKKNQRWLKRDIAAIKKNTPFSGP